MNKNESGFSLFEMLIVITLFATMAVLVSQSMAYSIKGSRKSENLAKVRSNLNSTIDSMERDIRSALTLGPCETNEIKIINESREEVVYSCVNDATNGNYIASNGARIVSNNIGLTTCSLVCNESSSGTDPNQVEIKVSAYDLNGAKETSANVTINTIITLRNR